MKSQEIFESRSKSVEDFRPDNQDLDELRAKFLPDWEMIDHKILAAKYVAPDHRQALEFMTFVNEISEQMDHFTEVTQDVAEVSVRTTTFDVKGLTILDFQIAMIIDDYAQDHGIQQQPITGNFELKENLRNWFREKWVRFNPQGKIMGPCARGSNKEGKPKCLPQSKAHAMGKKGRASAAARKRREDPDPERRGAARNVATKKK